VSLLVQQVKLPITLIVDSPSEITHNPVPSEKDIKWILEEVSRYLGTGKLYY
jgi:hypothetical protein